MPWTNVTSGEETNRYVILACSSRFTVTELCEQFGISRNTGYKHLERCAALGLAGLQPRSHRPHNSPQRTDSAPTKRSGTHSRGRTWARRIVYRGLLPARRRGEGTGPLDRAPTPTTRATHRPPPTPPTVPPTPPKPTLRMATCQPKHRSLPEKI